MTADAQHGAERIPPVRLLGVCLGLIVWSSCLLLLYAVLSLACILSPLLAGGGWLNPLLGLIWLIHLTALLWLLRRGRRQWRAPLPEAQPGTEKMLRQLTLLLHGLGLIGTIFIGFPLVMFPACV
jgi:hypothetical protein